MSSQNTLRMQQSAERKQAADEEHGRVCRAFGRVLKAARTASGKSQQTLSECAGADRSYLSMLERGLQQPTLAMLFRIAKALSMRPEVLVTYTLTHLENPEGEEDAAPEQEDEPAEAAEAPEQEALPAQNEQSRQKDVEPDEEPS